MSISKSHDLFSAAEMARKYFVVCLMIALSYLVCCKFWIMPSQRLVPRPQLIRPSPHNRQMAATKNGLGSGLSFTKSKNLTLTIRMAAVPKIVSLLYCVLLRSAALFWSPRYGPISLILDAESERDHQLAAKLRRHEQALGMQFDISYEPLPADADTIFHSTMRSMGYCRQLWSSFFTDMYVSADVVAWIDTDNMFFSPVTPENIFNGGRIRVLGVPLVGTRWERLVSDSVKTAIGWKTIARFPNFPIYLWRDTITNCRNHILKTLNVSRFGDAFVKIYPQGKKICPSDLILTYAYYFEHNRYSWHIDVKKQSLAKYNQHQVPAGFEIRGNETEPGFLQVATHKKYNFMFQGFCIAKRYVGTLPANCKMYENTTNFQHFSAIYNHLKTWCAPGRGRAKCARLIEAHYQNFAGYYRSRLMDLDLQRVLAVEEEAKKENISCSKIFEF
ncbi:uncharacterized protein LOC110990902 [Acanthaster planci]|uniref:Uncharacterized protein LOC110990902 n=1 Tax=Acanthaster planci TaxID=133434 RepID=A0A8B8A1R2_ACAPL|nr:uncharacterized protein LOC110990902 [Acanthaster planci]